MSNIGEIIKDLRVTEKLKQKDLADKLNVSISAVSQYENNLKRPSYEVLIAIADFFGVSADYLLGREE